MVSCGELWRVVVCANQRGISCLADKRVNRLPSECNIYSHVWIWCSIYFIGMRTTYKRHKFGMWTQYGLLTLCTLSCKNSYERRVCLQYIQVVQESITQVKCRLESIYFRNSKTTKPKKSIMQCSSNGQLSSGQPTQDADRRKIVPVQSESDHVNNIMANNAPVWETRQHLLGLLRRQ